MIRVKPSNRQSLLDIALQTSGGIEAAFDLSKENGRSISEPLEAGAELGTVAAVDKNVLAKYEARGIRPATELSAKEVEAAPYGGIGYMGIEIDFVVK